MTTTTEITNQSFPTLQEAYNWANTQINGGLPVQASRIWEDRIRKPRGSMARYIKILGVTPRAEKVCKEIEPNGEWRVEVEPPDTLYYKAGILGPIPVKTKTYRLSAWYSRFLPYAVAMLESEWGFECLGVDFQSINSYYTTCIGFCELGWGDGFVEAKDDQPEYNRIVSQDVDLFNEIYHASMQVRPPGLPFYEAISPCLVYVSLYKPERILKQIDEDCWMIQHVRDVCKEIGKPIPKGFN